ncbi:MAG: dTMP kinase [Hyphomicrobiales bacterium]|nr:dTMP kinase [Hyphomicrobiales bacterium]
MSDQAEYGRFITLEGGEGSGKSTQMQLIIEKLRQRGITAIATREPGGSLGSEEIRTLLVTGETNRWNALTEALLNFAARKEHIEMTIFPALKQGSWVVCDRFVDSTIAYQGYGHQLPLRDLETLNALVLKSFKPDLTFILDIDIESGLKRATAGDDGDENRFEKLDKEFHERVRKGFLEIAANNPERCVVIDARKETVVVSEEIWKHIVQRFHLDQAT